MYFLLNLIDGGSVSYYIMKVDSKVRNLNKYLTIKSGNFLEGFVIF
jgi:hypothetical protein